MKNKVFGSILVPALFAGLLMVGPGDAVAKKPSKLCQGIGEGVGYFVYFHRFIIMIERLDGQSADRLEELCREEVKKTLEGRFETARDLREPPFSLDPQKMVKENLGGYSVSFDKAIAQAAAKEGLGYVWEVYLYTAPAETEIDRYLKLSDDKGEVKFFDRVYFKILLISSSNNRTLAKTPEKSYSYLYWFFDKYPKARSGDPKKIPAGVNYYSTAQYRLFLRESLADAFGSISQFKKFVQCRAPGQ